jgi:hypothetical protein
MEWRIVRHFHQANIVQQMMPLDIQAFLKAEPTFKHDLALELIAAWVKEPPAIEAFMVNRPISKDYTGSELLTCLKKVSGP